MNGGEKAQTFGAIIVFAVVIIVGLYDIYAARVGSVDNTVSWLITEWAAKYPVLPFSLGVLIGHLFWPSVRH